MHKGIVAAVLPLAMLAGCASSREKHDLDRMLAGESALQGKNLAAAIAESEKYALGSEKNPVRVSMPEGERSYLARLRCKDGSAPGFTRQGSGATGVFGNIVDYYAVSCSGQQPVTVVMDMYHPEHLESRPLPGFTLAE